MAVGMGAGTSECARGCQLGAGSRRRPLPRFQQLPKAPTPAEPPSPAPPRTPNIPVRLRRSQLLRQELLLLLLLLPQELQLLLEPQFQLLACVVQPLLQLLMVRLLLLLRKVLPPLLKLRNLLLAQLLLDALEPLHQLLLLLLLPQQLQPLLQLRHASLQLSHAPGNLRVLSAAALARLLPLLRQRRRLALEGLQRGHHVASKAMPHEVRQRLRGWGPAGVGRRQGRMTGGQVARARCRRKEQAQERGCQAHATQHALTAAHAPHTPLPPPALAFALDLSARSRQLSCCCCTHLRISKVTRPRVQHVQAVGQGCVRHSRLVKGGDAAVVPQSRQQGLQVLVLPYVCARPNEGRGRAYGGVCVGRGRRGLALGWCRTCMRSPRCNHPPLARPR